MTDTTTDLDAVTWIDRTTTAEEEVEPITTDLECIATAADQWKETVEIRTGREEVVVLVPSPITTTACQTAEEGEEVRAAAGDQTERAPTTATMTRTFTTRTTGSSPRGIARDTRRATVSSGRARQRPLPETKSMYQILCVGGRQ